MISDERQFRRYYNDKRKEDRDRDSYRDRNNKDFSADRYDREYDYSTGYNHSRDYGGHAYNSRSQNGDSRYGSSRFGDNRNDNRDYRYSYGDERDYERYRDEDRSWHEGNQDQRERRNRDFRDNYSGSEREYPETPYRGRDYQDDRYENPGLSDRYPDRSSSRFDEDRQERFQNRGQRIQWDPDDVDRRNQYGTGMDRYRARYRQETLYGGRTEKYSTRNNHSSQNDREFFEDDSRRANSRYDQDRDPKKGKDWSRGNQEGYNRSRY